MSLLKLSTGVDKMVFMTDSTDHLTGKTGLTLTITASKNAAAFASVTPTVTERGNGWYALALTSSHTDTLGDFVLHITSTGADPTDLTWQVLTLLPGEAVTVQSGTGTGQISVTSGVVSSNVTQIDGLATNGNNATLNLKKLDILNADVSGIAVSVATTNSSAESVRLSNTGTGSYALRVKTDSGATASCISVTKTGIGNAVAVTSDQNGYGAVVLQSKNSGGIFSAIKLENIMSYFKLLARKDAFTKTDHAEEFASLNADSGSGGGVYDNETDSLEANRDNIGTAGDNLMVGLDSGAITSTTLDGTALAAIRAAFLVVNDTLNGPTVGASTVTLGGTSVANDDALNGLLLAHFNSLNELVQVRTITDWDNTTFTITVDKPWSVTPLDGDAIRIYEHAQGSPLDDTNGVETGLTVRGALRIITAALTGKLSGAGTTTVTIRNYGDTKDRITATVDTDGNRSAVTTDVT